MVTKLFSWFRSVFSSFGEESALPVAHQLVERARAQDQVAIATICEVRENAKRGNAKAKETLEAVIAYAKAKPVEGMHGDSGTNELREACFGADPEQVGPSVLKVAASNPYRAIATIANSCNALEMAGKIGECLEDPAFHAAFKNPKVALQWMKKMNHDGQHALLLGYVLGLATRLQMVRNPRVPLSVYSQRVAWELD
jgi:hypothetical protein